MIRTTKSHALEIQASQTAHYAAIYGNHVHQLVAAATRADELADGEHDVVVINRFIPRGAAIEALIPEKVAAEAAIRAERAAWDAKRCK